MNAERIAFPLMIVAAVGTLYVMFKRPGSVASTAVANVNSQNPLSGFFSPVVGVNGRSSNPVVTATRFDPPGNNIVLPYDVPNGLDYSGISMPNSPAPVAAGIGSGPVPCATC